MVSLLVWRGLIPAFTVLDTDFPNYYVSARLALKGNFDRVYDDAWFQDQIQSLGINQMGKFSPFPPISAFVVMPLVWLGPLNALRAWSVINIAVLFCLTALLSKMLKKDWLWCSLVLLLSGHALINNFRFGQFYLILTFMTLCSLFLWQRDRRWLSGALAGIGAAVKYFPIIMLPLLISRREWRIVLSLFLTLLLLFVGSAALLGVQPYLHFASGVLLPHLSGNIQDQFSPSFQSWNSLFRRLLIFDPVLNPNPLFNSSAAYSASLGAVYLAVLSLLAFGVRRATLRWKDNSLNVEFALLCIGGILLFPASATYHFLLLSLPISILLALGKASWCMEQKVLVGLYVCIGFIPYSSFKVFDGKGFLTLLAYPRLFLCSMIFAVAVAFVARFDPDHPGVRQPAQIV